MRQRVTENAPIKKIMQNVFLLVVLTLSIMLFIPPAP
jgi:hypothetical protein